MSFDFKTYPQGPCLKAFGEGRCGRPRLHFGGCAPGVDEQPEADAPLPAPTPIPDVAVEFSKLGPLTEKDVVLVTYPPSMSTPAFSCLYDALMEACAKTGAEAAIVFLPREVNVSMMDREQRLAMIQVLAKGLEP